MVDKIVLEAMREAYESGNIKYDEIPLIYREYINEKVS